MTYTVRGEIPGDYSKITDVVYNAFLDWRPGEFKAECVLVDMLRHNERFDPEISLVAEIEDEIMGHVMFSPAEFRIRGEKVMGVYLAPLCASPDCQRTGVGQALMEEGHRRCREKGYAFSILCGHPEYYPKAGYLPQMFSLGGSRVGIDLSGFDGEGYGERPIVAGDLAWILPAWEKVHGGDRLAWYPGRTISQWISQSPQSRASVITHEGNPLGYIHYHTEIPGSIREFIPLKGNAYNMLRWFQEKYGTEEAFHISMEKAVLEALVPQGKLEIEDVHKTADPFMLKVLDEKNQTVSGYVEACRRDSRNAGVIAFPPICDME